MGYFSNHDIDRQNLSSLADFSYPTPEMQLQWRIEDLIARLKTVHKSSVGVYAISLSNCRYSRTDIEYALPEHLYNVDDIITAIAIAKYHLRISERESTYDPDTHCSGEGDVLPGQITIWEMFEKPIRFTDDELQIAA